MDSCGAHGRGRLVLAAALVALAMLASPAVGRARVSGGRANHIMVHLLGGFVRLPNIVVLRLPKPLRAGTRVSIADPGGGRVTLHHPAWLFWADLAPQKDLDHGSVLALIDARNGKVVRAGRLSRWPLVNGKLPAFLRSRQAYASRRYRVLARGGGRPLASGDLVMRSAFRARSAAAPGQCVIVLGPPSTSAGDWNWGEHYADAAAFTTLARGLGISPIYPAYNSAQLADRISLAQSAGCSKITIFATGEGSAPPGWIDPTNGSGPYPGNPRANLQIGDSRIWVDTLAKVLTQRYTGRPAGSPPPQFTLIVQGCFSGRFVPGLQGVPGVNAVITSSAPNAEATRESNLGKLLDGASVASPFVTEMVTGIRAAFAGAGGNLGAAARAAFLNDVPYSSDEPEMLVNGQIIAKTEPAQACTMFHQPGCANFDGGVYDGGDQRAYAVGSLEINIGPGGYCQDLNPCKFTNCSPACPHLDTAFPLGSRVTAIATPGTGSVFARWDQGVCAGQGATCTFTANYDSCITAEFLLTNPTAPPQSLPTITCRNDPNYTPTADLSAADPPFPPSQVPAAPRSRALARRW